MTAFTAAVSFFESVGEHPEAAKVFLPLAQNSARAGVRRTTAKQNATEFRFTYIS
jgi:hypothetical protein